MSLRDSEVTDFYARVEDIKKDGIDSFLSPFVDLNTLYFDSVSINSILIPSIMYFKEHFVAFLADNMAEHSLGGFKESSWAKRICRCWMATVSSVQISYCEDDCQLRTATEHERQCLSQWNDDNSRSISKEYEIGFKMYQGSVTNGISQAIMHGSFLGVVTTVTNISETYQSIITNINST